MFTCYRGYASVALLLLSSSTVTQAFAQSTVDEIEVVATSPLGSSPASSTAGNSQAIDGDELRKQRALDLTELMNRNLGSVYVNEAQSNPLQPDVQYRGFVGSPLLGLPQGIAVYQDGVRVNEPFGDTVNWALVPASAVDTLQLVPGSDPLFGLNALGGSISIATKNGFTYEQTQAEMFAGSFGRFGSSLESGGKWSDTLAYYGTVSYLEEDGWRDFSGTRATRAFGSVRWQAGDTFVDAKITLADTTLTGNGAAPVQLLAIDREAVFTHPDDTNNELHMLSVVGAHEVSDSMRIRANAYVRDSDISTLNGDDSDYEPCETNGAILCDEGEPAEDLDGNLIPALGALIGATVNRTETRQSGAGLALQAELDGGFGGRENLFLVGFSWDQADVRFAAGTELGSLDEGRGAVGGNVFVADAVTRLDTEAWNGSLFLSDTLSLGERLHLGVAARYNRTRVKLKDQLGTALDGDHSFSRVNPSIGLTWSDVNREIYGRYSESSRVPSPVELTCADEDDPCRLPNAFLSDPPLEMVVAHTWEAGMRAHGNGLAWHAGLFHTTNEDDIIFISAGALTNEGYFDNVGRTRRLGFELNVEGDLGDSVEWFINYTGLEATFRDRFVVTSPNNPEAIDGETAVRPGNRIPLIPEHLFKGGLSWEPVAELLLGFDIQANSGLYLRGDEGNDNPEVGGYAVVNVQVSFQAQDWLRIFANINNLFDERYETFGLFGEPDEVLGDEFDDPTFLSPGAPRGAWVGVEVTLD